MKNTYIVGGFEKGKIGERIFYPFHLSKPCFYME